VLIAPDGRLHAVCTGDYSGGSAGRIDVLDPVALARVGQVEIGGSPARAALGPDGAMWVVGHGGGLRRYDAITLAVRDDPVDPALPAAGLSAIAFDEDAGRAYVTAFPDDLLLAIDATSRLMVDAWIVGDGPVDVLVQRP
jgi:streptogramin lyase